MGAAVLAGVALSPLDELCVDGEYSRARAPALSTTPAIIPLRSRTSMP